MFSFSLKFYRRLACQGSVKIICKNVPGRTTLIHYYRTVTSEVASKRIKTKLRDKNNNVTDFDVNLATTLMNSHPEPEKIEWEGLTKELETAKVKNISSAIFQALGRLNNADAAISYYNYLNNKEEELTIFDLMRFCKLLLVKKNEISKYEDLINVVYEDLKEYMGQSVVIQGFILKLVSEIPSCFLDFAKMVCESPDVKGHSDLVFLALEHNHPDLAFLLLNRLGSDLVDKFLSVYVNYMLRMAKENNFLPDMITKFTDYCGKKAVTISCSDFFIIINSFVNNLNKLQNKYHSSVTLCRVDKSICSTCNSKLIEKPITNTEFNNLQKKFLLDVLIHKKKVCLSVSDAELKKFQTFLKRCKPYNVVVDGLNVLYQRNVNGVQTLVRLMNYFVEKGLSVLIIAKKHAKYILISALKSQSVKIQKKVQLYFVNNISDDDLFILYAALSGGLGTYWVSGDFMSPYGSFLDDDTRSIYLRWKNFYRYHLKSDDLISPQPHLGLPQLTVSDENRKLYIWHLSFKNDSSCSTRVNDLKCLDWICLKVKEVNVKKTATAKQPEVDPTL